MAEMAVHSQVSPALLASFCFLKGHSLLLATVFLAFSLLRQPGHNPRLIAFYQDACSRLPVLSALRISNFVGIRTSVSNLPDGISSETCQWAF
jgi:hypothetical protein